jgi:hypothetical protein
MTVATEDSAISYTGNGSTTAYPVPFPFIASEHLLVTLTTSGVDSVKTEGTDYTVAGEGDEDGGTVTFLAAPATGVGILIERDVPLTQSIDFRSQGSFSPSIHEEAFDKLTMADQQQQIRIEDLETTQEDQDETLADHETRVVSLEEGTVVQDDRLADLESVTQAQPFLELLSQIATFTPPEVLSYLADAGAKSVPNTWAELNTFAKGIVGPTDVGQVFLDSPMPMTAGDVRLLLRAPIITGGTTPVYARIYANNTIGALVITVNARYNAAGNNYLSDVDTGALQLRISPTALDLRTNGAPGGSGVVLPFSTLIPLASAASKNSANTWLALQTFLAGLTVSSGTAALQALTATTGAFSGALTGTTGAFSGALSGAALSGTSLALTSNPATGVAITNELHAKNIAKAFASFVCTGGFGAQTVNDSFNVSSVVAATNGGGFGEVTITFAQPMATANYVVTMGNNGGTVKPNIQTKSRFVVGISLFTTSTGAALSLAAMSPHMVDVIVMGVQ